MKIFRNGWKINFADANDVLVGFDYEGNCCENFGYYFSLTPMGEEMEEPSDLETYLFEKTFFRQEIKHGDREEATFMLSNKGNTIFLNIFNDHNGYYGHGFDFTWAGNLIKSGTL